MNLDHLLDRNVTWAQGKTHADPSFFVRMAEQQSDRQLLCRAIIQRLFKNVARFTAG